MSVRIKLLWLSLIFLLLCFKAKIWIAFYTPIQPPLNIVDEMYNYEDFYDNAYQEAFQTTCAKDFLFSSYDSGDDANCEPNCFHEKLSQYNAPNTCKHLKMQALLTCI